MVYIVEWDSGGFFIGDEHLIDIDFSKVEIVGHISDDMNLVYEETKNEGGYNEN